MKFSPEFLGDLPRRSRSRDFAVPRTPIFPGDDRWLIKIPKQYFANENYAPPAGTGMVAEVPLPDDLFGRELGRFGAQLRV